MAGNLQVDGRLFASRFLGGAGRWIRLDDRGDCGMHVFKGGSYNDFAWGLRSSWRYWDFVDMRGIEDGFRCARDVVQ